MVNNIVKRDWTASDIGRRVALVNAARFISPFTIVYFTEEDMALMQQCQKHLINVSLVSTLEVKATCTKLVASTPTDSERFMMMIKRFANLLFAPFPLS